MEVLPKNWGTYVDDQNWHDCAEWSDRYTQTG